MPLDGEQGDPGPQGPEGLVWRGPWDVDIEYLIDDAVSYLGSSYLCLKPCKGVTPVSGVGNYWDVLALEGDPGDPGEPGEPGASGPYILGEYRPVDATITVMPDGWYHADGGIHNGFPTLDLTSEPPIGVTWWCYCGV